jgi:hypothetical protein
MIKKTKLYLITGIILLINFVFCFAAFIAVYREKHSLAAAFWALALSFGATGAALIAIYASKEDIRLQDLRKAISEKDHWFHSFEYPECNEPKIKIDDTKIPYVETETDI